MNDGYRALLLKDGEQVQARSKPAVCEMKRLWVCDAFRGHDLGKRLAREAMQLAGALRWRTMRLNTLSQVAAQRSVPVARIPRDRARTMTTRFPAR